MNEKQEAARDDDHFYSQTPTCVHGARTPFERRPKQMRAEKLATEYGCNDIRTHHAK